MENQVGDFVFLVKTLMIQGPRIPTDAIIAPSLQGVICREISQVSFDDRFAAIGQVGGGAMSCSALAGGGCGPAAPHARLREKDSMRRPRAQAAKFPRV